MVTSVSVVVLLGILIVLGQLLADRLPLTPPAVLVGLGTVVGFIPGVPPVRLAPEVVLALFLPALLFWESLTTSVREIRANLRPIALLAVGLVIATAGIVAVVAHEVALSWPMSWVLGAVVAPTDATALSSITARLPRRMRTTLKAESLINDGTALVVYAVAVEVATGRQSPGLPDVSLRLAGAYAGGVVVGVTAQCTVLVLRRCARRSSVENAISVLTPFLAYLPAERLHASGVVAVVTCGLLGSRLGPLVIPAGTRQQAIGFWRVTTFILNAALFVLIGLQVQPLVRVSESTALTLGLVLGVIVTCAVIAARLGWMYTVPYLIRVLDRRISQRHRREGARHRLPSAWAGLRGAVSLAAALAVPTTRLDGSALDGRDVVVLATLVVIVCTLTVQGSTMGLVLRWANLPEDLTEQQEQRMAERVVAATALRSVRRRAAELGANGAVQARVVADYKSYLARMHSEVDHPQSGNAPLRRDDPALEQALRAALLRDQRAALLGLRRAGAIDDVVLRRIQAQLDAEEIRLTGTTFDD